jgi:hypothetical protein
VGYTCRIEERGKLHQPDSVIEACEQVAGNAQRQPGLACAAGASERDQSPLTLEHGPSDTRDVPITSDQGRAFGKQIVPDNCLPAAAHPTSSHAASKVFVTLRLVIK